MKITVTKPIGSPLIHDACELQLYPETHEDQEVLEQLDSTYELVGMGRDAETMAINHVRIRLMPKPREERRHPRT